MKFASFRFFLLALSTLVRFLPLAFVLLGASFLGAFSGFFLSFSSFVFVCFRVFSAVWCVLLCSCLCLSFVRVCVYLLLGLVSSVFCVCVCVSLFCFWAFWVFWFFFGLVFFRVWSLGFFVYMKVSTSFSLKVSPGIMVPGLPWSALPINTPQLRLSCRSRPRGPLCENRK